MRLTDTLAEQVLLEQILERSKPPLPPGAQGRHPLLVTPFRYRPRHGSRFRRAGALGVWYGAEALRTACAEVAYWRWRFIIDSAGLAGEELLTQHLFFRARVEGTCLDLSAAPWNRQRAWWRHSSDYSHTQSLAEAARERGVGWIRYASARDPAGVCAAALEPEAVVELDAASQQSWSCRTTTRSVRLIHGSERHEWLFSAPPDRAGAAAARGGQAPGERLQHPQRPGLPRARSAPPRGQHRR
jgi:hypothetical protein